jgi:hypothetical protein
MEDKMSAAAKAIKDVIRLDKIRSRVLAGEVSPRDAEFLLGIVDRLNREAVDAIYRGRYDADRDNQRDADSRAWGKIQSANIDTCTEILYKLLNGTGVKRKTIQKAVQAMLYSIRSASEKGVDQGGDTGEHTSQPSPEPHLTSVLDLDGP